MQSEQPFVPAGVSMRELSVKAIVLGVVLSMIMSGANAYLGLFAGMTVSASIPAAVISMAALRPFGSNILENNIVQTATSAGESLAAGVIFTLPALVMLGVWTGFDYLETTMIAGFGGLLGVLFTIPLRRALIVERPLRFPEGVATSEVLKVGNQRGVHVGILGLGAALGALFKLGYTGLKLWRGIAETATYAGGTVLYAGMNMSPALLGVGYIVGLNIALLVLIGGALNWLFMIPIVAWIEGVPEGASALEAAGTLWSTRTRYVGVGAMMVGGLWALVSLRSSLIAGVRSGVEAYRNAQAGQAIARTERDIPMQWVGLAVALSVVPLFFIFYHVTGIVWVSALMAVIMLVAGFLFSAVAGYMAGLVGSSNNPVSGVTIATILTSSLLLVAMLGSDSKLGPAAAILIGGVVCCASAIAGDNMQDLKAGRLLGATPYKQQILQGVGVFAAALVVAPVLNLLLEAYGIGVPTERHPDPLRAPQASLMASVAKGVFTAELPWGLLAAGGALAAAVIAIDEWLARSGSSVRAPVLAVAVGIYLPVELAVPIAIGGVVSWLSLRKTRRESSKLRPSVASTFRAGASRQGMLFSAGLITGEALLGILLAAPIAASGRHDILAWFGVHEWVWPGLLLFAVVTALLYRSSSRASATDT